MRNFYVLIIISLLVIAGCTRINTGRVSRETKDDSDTLIVREEDVALSDNSTEDLPDMLPENLGNFSLNETGEAQTVKEFNITAEDWNFYPAAIEVDKGDRVMLHLKNTEGMHGFMLEGYNISEELPLNEVVTVEFVADKEGAFSFYCNVPCGEGHKDMRGILIVRS